MEEKHNILLDNFTIPAEVALNKKLDRTCLLLFSLINKLDNSRTHCYASNTYLATMLDTSPNTISISISTLIEQRYVEQVSFDGRIRVIKINGGYINIHKHFRVESDDRISGFKDQQKQPIADRIPSKSEENNEQPIADRIGSLSRNDEYNKEIDNKEKESVFKAPLNSRNSVPTVKSKIIINRNDNKPIILHPKKKININRNVELKIEDEPEPVKPRIPKLPKMPVPKKSSEVYEVLDYWQRSGFPVHKENSNSEIKAVNHIYALLDGSLFRYFKDKGVIRKYSVREIKLSIDNLATSAFNINYMPEKPEIKLFFQRMPLCNFFYNPQKGRDEDKSLFLKNLFSKPKLVSESKFHLATDTTPRVTKILLNWYKNNFGNKINGPVPTSDVNKCVYCGKTLKQFYEDNKSKLVIGDYFKRIYGQHDEVSFLAVQLTRALDKELRENDSLFSVFHLGWLSSEKTVTDRLPKFLKSENMMKQ